MIGATIRHAAPPAAIHVPIPTRDDMEQVREAIEAASVVLALTPDELTNHGVHMTSVEAQHNAVALMSEAAALLAAMAKVVIAARDRLATALETKGNA